jgi:hypothetical protein
LVTVVSRRGWVYDRIMVVWRRVALPLLLSVFGLLWAAAHALVHDVVSPGAQAHGAGHAGTLETYAGYLPTSLALCLVLATAIAAGVALGKRWTGVSGRALWLFGLVPVLGFAADALLPTGSPSGAGLVELVPVVVIGLLVQLPFAVTAVGLGSTILLLAERLAWALSASVGASRATGLASTVTVGSGRIPTRVLAGVDRSRAPPAAYRS